MIASPLCFYHEPNNLMQEGTLQYLPVGGKEPFKITTPLKGNCRKKVFIPEVDPNFDPKVFSSQLQSIQKGMGRAIIGRLKNEPPEPSTPIKLLMKTVAKFTTKSTFGKALSNTPTLNKPPLTYR